MNDYIPLYARLRYPIAVYIVNNNLIGMYETGISYHGNPIKVFELLKQLYNYPPAKKIIPSILHEYLEGKIRVIEKDPNREYERVFGLQEMANCNCCFDFDLKINAKADYPVILYNFVFEFGIEKIPYDYELHLPIETAYIILANICTTIITPYIDSLIKYKAKKKEFIFDEKLLKQLNKGTKDSHFQTVCDFTIAYVSYQQKQLERKQITPYELLRLNGVELITILSNKPFVEKFLEEVLEELSNNYQSLTRNQKIMFYSYFLVVDEVFNDEISSIYKKIKDFKQQNELRIKQMEKELLIGLPLLGKRW